MLLNTNLVAPPDIYYLVFPGDAIWPTKSLAAFVYILEVAQTCIVTSDAFRNFGSGFVLTFLSVQMYLTRHGW